jgi:inner membrane protein
MDPITHALSGALLASSVKKRATSQFSVKTSLPTWKWVLVLAVAAMSPDIDILLEQISNVATLTDRRGITHSLLGLPLMALFVGGLFTLVFRDRARFSTYLLLSALGIALHILFDLLNAFGVMLFAPLSFQRFDLGITFIIDLWLALLMLLGLAASLVWRRSRIPALVMSGCVLLYLATMFWAKSAAEKFAQASTTSATAFADSPSTVPVTSAVYPRPLSPFNWTVVLKRDGEYRVSHVNVLSTTPIVANADSGFITTIRSQFLPMSLARWKGETLMDKEKSDASPIVARAWNHPDFAFFRTFAPMPAFIKVETNANGQCAFFHDLRFVSPGRDEHPFSYGVCFLGDVAKVYQFAYDGQHQLVPHPRRLLF